MEAAETSDRRATGFALVSATLMIGQQVAGKASRDALFLSQFDITQLPKAVIIAAVLSMAAVLTMSRLLARFGPHPLVPLVFAGSAAGFVAEWMVFGYNPGAAVALLYLHIAIFGAILISGFWSVVNERFDPHAARRTIARVAAAATLGGVLGGLLAQQVTAVADLRTMFLVLGLLHLACVVTVLAIGSRPEGPGSAPAVPSPSGLQLLARNAYMRRMGTLIALVAVAAALLDYVLKAEASSRLEGGEALVTFFAGFYAVLGIASFAVQSLIGSRLMERVSPGRVLALLPLVVLVAGSVAVAALGLWTAAVARGSHAVLANSLFRSAFEVLYAPVPPQRKRPTKTIIDVAADRLGDMAGGGMVLLILALAPVLTNQVVIAVAMAVAGLALYVVARLHQGYISQLATNLRRGVPTEPVPLLDPTTQYVLGEAGPAAERHLLLERVRQMREARRREGAEPRLELESREDGAAAPEGAGVDEDAPSPRSLAGGYARAVAAFVSREPARIRRAIASEPLDIRLVPYLIPLLEIDEVADDVRTELRWQAPRIIGQLSDALRDPDVPLAARLRVPSVLEVSHNPRAVRVLYEGLDAPEFPIRFACGRTLARMRRRNPALALSRYGLLTRARRELHVDTATWQARTLQLDGTPDLAGVQRPRFTRSTEHVFTLLGLAQDQDAMELALKALAEGNRALRGTALEYLGNVVPEDIRERLWAHMGISGPGVGRGRTALELVAELRRSLARAG